MFSMAFQAKVMVYDPYLKPAAQTTWVDTLGTERVSFVPNLDDLLAAADVVSLHVPLMESTRNLIAARELRLMKRSAIIINSARGGIINEDDLATALEQGQIFGAGLDAFDSEPPSLKKHERFCRLDNVVMT
jgi:phosphoglycerate dehydrogenase-like enzyme